MHASIPGKYLWCDRSLPSFNLVFSRKYALFVEPVIVTVQMSPSVETRFVVARYPWSWNRTEVSEFGLFVFLPANQLDRFIRPDIWNPKP